jgi:hypothetical protein
MSPRVQERIIELLTEIQLDIRSIKSDVQSLLSHASTAQPGSLSNERFEPFVEPIEPQNPNVNDKIIQYLREKFGDDEMGTD